MDYGHRQTDEKLKRLERRIAREYENAYNEVSEKCDAYFEKFAQKDAEMQMKLAAEEITEQEYKQWRYNQMMTGERWQALRNDLANDLVRADEIALDMVNGTLPEVYANNFNFGTYEVEKGANINTNFTLVDRDTVMNLLKDDPDIFPMPTLNKIKDGIWNRGHIVSAIAQGVLQGESIPNIAKRLESVVGMDRSAAIRNARTYTTAAENAGRMDSYHRAEDMGIQMRKMWVATDDERTRDSHRELDKVVVDTDEEFPNGLMYPGDPSGDPSEVYNCRCTLVSVIKGHEYKDVDYRSKEDYEEWKRQKEEQKTGEEETKQEPVKIEFTPAKTIEEAEAYAKENFVVQNKWAGEGNVSFKGMSLDNANGINEELTNLFAQNNLPPFRNIGMMNLRKNEFKDCKDAPMAYRGIFNGELYFNPNILKSEKTLADYMAKGQEAFDYCVNNMDKFSGKQLDLVKMYAEAGRQTVADSSDNPLKAMLDHEFGHHVDHQIILKDKEFAQVTKDGMDEFGRKLSGYANHTRGEYVAESFCAYNNNLGDIDPSLKEIFDKAVRK